MPVLASKIIWVRHNFKPHNRLKRPFTHRINCSLLKLISNRVVTLEKVSEFDSTLIPHPLYEDDHTLLTHIDSFSEEKNANSFLFFGTIKPYKKLEILLNAWPKLRQLRIVGYCQDEKYFKELQSIIEQRKLFVEWTNEYVSDEYLEHLLSKTRYVIMPHDDGAMISSGSFYQAINFGANVICFDSDFARKKANLHRFVHIVASPNMDEFLTELPFVATKQVMREAFESYGRKKIHCSWKQLLKPE
jgi:beta-1,4-mannosyltransferase